MIPLAPKFRSRGFDWRIVQREGDVAIVEQSREGWENPVLNVVVVQKHRERPAPDGSTIPAREGLPSWEQWGRAAWTASDLPDAKRRFNALVDSTADVVANRPLSAAKDTEIGSESS